MEKCPLCGSAVNDGICISCGYEVPEESSVAAAYNYDPSDYPSEQPEALPEKKEIKYDMMSAASADDRSYINGSGAVNVRDGQYNGVSGSDDDIMPEGRNAYTRSNPAPYITKESSLQDDIANFYAERSGQTPAYQSGANSSYKPARNSVSNSAPYITKDSSLQDDIANFYAVRAAGGAAVNTVPAPPENSVSNSAPYITKNSSLQDDISNFYAARAAGQQTGGKRIDFVEEQRIYNEKIGVFDSPEIKTDPYEGLAPSEKVIRASVDFIKKHWWKFLLLVFLPTSGLFIGTYFLVRFRRELRASYLVSGISFIIAAVFLKVTGFGISGLDDKLLGLFRRL